MEPDKMRNTDRPASLIFIQRTDKPVYAPAFNYWGNTGQKNEHFNFCYHF
jgi:hypothetical protein